MAVFLLALTAWAIAGCGGGGSGDGDRDAKPAPTRTGGSGTSPPTATPGAGSTPAPTATPGASLGAISIETLELAQTHVLPPEGRSWSLANAEESIDLIGGREALLLVELSASNPSAPRIEGRRGATSLGSVELDPPSALPPTEDDGDAYADDRHSAILPASWLAPGLELRVAASSHTPSTWQAVTVGAGFPVTLRVLPFYVFGANEMNSQPLSATGAPNAATIAEIFAKWPVASLEVANHPAGKVEWPTLVVSPRGGNAAYVASNADDYLDGFAGLSATLSMLDEFHEANGEDSQPVQYYAPLLALDASGDPVGPGGGLGGGDDGAGDIAYRGVFIHEQGHAFGLPHVGEAFDDGEYPYDWGSFAGSAWGFDQNLHEFLAPFLPPTAEEFDGCEDDTFAGHPRAIDAAGRCVKQDPMQSGSGDQSSHHRFATFSDYSTAVMQRWFEGVTTVGSGGSHEFDGGKLVRDASFPGGWKRWDGIDRAWVNHTPATRSGGIFGLDDDLPLQRNVPVYAIGVTISNASTAGVTQIYPPLRFTGNLMRTIDPTRSEDRAAITPDTGTYFWYCRNGGCDYTLRITYAGGSQRHVLLQGGFRPFNQASGSPPATANNPRDGDSFEEFAVNVPDDGAITGIQLLSTPRVWLGMPTSPTVLASR